MFADEDLHRHAMENIVQADALLLGRVTYEMMEAAWRLATRTVAMPEWTEPFARTIDAARKYVVSSTLERVDWNAELVRGDVGTAVQHGPHLPIASDTFGVMFEADGVAKRVSRALPQWNVVMMPPLHYGETGANDIVIHPGTYGIRHTTLRSRVADIGAQVAQNGFKRIFVLTGHGSPTHGVAVNDACDFVSETFGVGMLHVSALFRADEKIQSRGKTIAAKHFSAADIASFGLDVDGLSDLILRAAGGENLLKAPRMPASLDPGRAGVFAKALDNERALEAKLDAWLAARRR